MVLDQRVCGLDGSGPGVLQLSVAESLCLSVDAGDSVCAGIPIIHFHLSVIACVLQRTVKHLWA